MDEAGLLFFIIIRDLKMDEVGFINYFEIWKTMRDFFYYLTFFWKITDEACRLLFINLIIVSPLGTLYQAIPKIW